MRTYIHDRGALHKSCRWKHDYCSDNTANTMKVKFASAQDSQDSNCLFQACRIPVAPDECKIIIEQMDINNDGEKLWYNPPGTVVPGSCTIKINDYNNQPNIYSLTKASDLNFVFALNNSGWIDLQPWFTHPFRCSLTGHYQSPHFWYRLCLIILSIYNSAWRPVVQTYWNLVGRW